MKIDPNIHPKFHFQWNPDAIPGLLRGSMATAVAVREFEYLNARFHRSCF